MRQPRPQPLNALSEPTTFSAPVAQLARWSALSAPLRSAVDSLRRQLERARRSPLVLRVGSGELCFHSVAEFEFGLTSRTEFPVRKAAQLMDRTEDELEQISANLRQVEKRFSVAFSAAVNEPDRIHVVLASLEPSLFSSDHNWRDIIRALNDHGTEYNDFRHVTLVKYMQYLAARQSAIRRAYLERRTFSDPDAWRDLGPMPSSPQENYHMGGLDEMAKVIQLRSDRKTLRSLPRGEAIRLRLRAGEDISLRLAAHAFRIYGGKPCCLVDLSSGASYPLAGGRNVIGRHSGNDVVVDLSYLTVSRKHLIVDIAPNELLTLTDISSHGSAIGNSVGGVEFKVGELTSHSGNLKRRSPHSSALASA